MAICSEKTWRSIVAITECRSATKSREDDLVRTRKELKERLTELGAGSTQEHLSVSREYTLTLFQIDLMRARVRSLADKVETAIKAELNGEKFDFDPKAFSIKLTEAEIFTEAEDEDEEPDGSAHDGAGEKKSKKSGKSASTPPIPGIDSAQLSTEEVNRNAVFPGEFAIMRIDNRSTVRRVATDRDHLQQLIEQAIGGPFDVFKFATGDVIIGGAPVIRVTFTAPAGAPGTPASEAEAKDAKPAGKKKPAHAKA